MLIKHEDCVIRAIRLAGHGQLNVMTQALDDAGRRLSRYLLFAMSGQYRLRRRVGLALYLIGVPHALLLGSLRGSPAVCPLCRMLVGAALPVALRWPFSPAGTMQRWHSECFLGFWS